MSFYQSYRPQLFSDLIGQDHVRDILVQAMKNNRLVHAYLFCGTRGTGKTSTARLLAKAMNCPNKTDTQEPCNECDVCKSITNGSCMDVIEIDAASNRGIDEIRQLQEQSRFRPQVAQHKIFIIDEVHMLTKEAFNALLKTLEEPPTHLYFILATTESHKLPATIISRCQRHDFFTPNHEAIIRYLTRITKHEKIAIDADGLGKIAELARGSFRDAASIFEQLSTKGEKLTAESVATLLGLPDKMLVERYLVALSSQGHDDGLQADILAYIERGGSVTAFVDMLFTHYEQSLRGGEVYDAPGMILNSLLHLKNEVKHSPIPHLPLLVRLFPESAPQLESIVSIPRPLLANPAPTQAPKSLSQNPVASDTESEKKAISQSSSTLKSTSSTRTPTESSHVEQPIVVDAATLKSVETVTIEVAEQVPPAVLPSGEISDKWQLCLTKLLEDSQSSIVSMLRTARPLDWEAPVLSIGVQFKFHADQLAKQKNRDILESLFSQTFGSPVRVEFRVVQSEDLASAAEEMF